MPDPLNQRSADAAAPAIPFLRIDVPGADILRRMLESPLAPGCEGSSPVRSTIHERYFDTPSGALEARGVICRLRTFENGARSLAVIEHSPITGVDGPPTAITEAAIEHHGETAVFADSAPERRLRELVDAADLAPTLEVLTECFRRHAPHGLFRRATAECELETVTVRVGGRSRAFHEASVRCIDDQDALVRLIAAEWASRHAAVSPETTRFSRIRAAAASLRRDAAAAKVGVDVTTVMIIARDGRIACLRDGAELRLPSCSGSGVVSATQLVAVSGVSGAGLAPLRVTPRTAGQALVDVWFGALPRESRDPRAVVWMPVMDLLSHAGAPYLTDPPSLAGLGVLIESEVIDGVLEGTDAWRRDSSPNVAVTSHPMTLNAELSLLDFTARVLTMAEDRDAALADRFRMLAITGANVDEFVMVRLPELRARARDPARRDADDGLTPGARFDAARLRLAALRRAQSRCFAQCVEALAATGVRVRRWEDLPASARQQLRDWFAETIAPRIASDGMTLVLGHAFPRLPHLTLSLCVIGREPDDGAWRVAQFDLPRDCGRFVPVPGSADLIPLEDIVRHAAGAVHPDLDIRGAYVFRVIREGDLTLNEGNDLYERVTEATRRRAFNRVARVEVERAMPPPVRDALLATLQIEPGIANNALESSDLHASPGPLAIADARELVAHAPTSSAAAPSGVSAPVPSLWTKVAARDRLMHHPYDPYDASVVPFFIAAADDPAVQAIWVTLYRVGEASPVVDALLAAHAAGKRVTAYIELTARFDETRNLSWVGRLERAGVSVAYGHGDLKCHAKVALVERWEEGAARRYAHIGTGNYNTTSARMYTDFSLLTADRRVTDDLHRFFGWLVGDRATALHCDHCLVAPRDLLAGVLARIQREIDHARAARPARIRLKLNALSEQELVNALYRASEAGVEIDMVVRGICTIRPGVPGLSDRIRVSSRIGRFLEHGRIYHFANGGDDDYLIGSADWRPRNMRRRIEVVVPVLDAGARGRLATILDAEVADPARWRLAADGTYQPPSAGESPSADQRFAAERE